MTIGEAVNQVAMSTGIPKTIVKKTYRAYWKAIREHITSLPLKEDLTEEEFMSLRPNVNIPSIGKLFVTLDRYTRIKKMYNTNKEKNNATHQED